MPNLLYLLPTNFEHEGIRLKVMGQLACLKQHYSLRFIFLNYKRHSSFSSKIWQTLLFEFRSLLAMLTHKNIYIRYNPKAFFINFLCLPLSFFKTIYIEHNTIMDTELAFLNRYKEHRLHLITLIYLSLSRCIHLAVNNELKKTLEKNGLKRIIYTQNAYLAPPLHKNFVDWDLINQCLSFKKSVDYMVIFCGSGCEWHGLTEVLELVKSDKEIGLIVVGPYKKITQERCLFIDKLDSDTLTQVIERCDFAIGTFRWDKIGITEGSPLKSRQFLCHGCPIIINYYDSAADYSTLQPFIIDYRIHGESSLEKAKKASRNKKDLAKDARQYLSWDIYFKQAGLL